MVMHEAAPAVGAESVDVFVLRNLDRLQESLGKVSEGRGGSGLDVATSDGGKKAAESSGEITSRKIITREEKSEVAAELVGGVEMRLFASVETAVVRMAGLARSAAAAAVGERERTQGRAVLGGDRGHESLLVGFGIT